MDPVNIQIVSTFDGRGTAEATAGLKSVEAEAAAAQQSVNRSGSGLTPVPGALSGINTAEEAAAQAEVTQQLAQQAAIESQIQVIADLRLNLAAAQALGEEQLVAEIRNELSIRTGVLTAMRSQVLTATELNALSEREAGLLAAIKVEQAGAAVATEATAAGSALAGASLARARNEATTLARELATGGNTTRTIGALAGSLGPVLGTAGVAAFVLYENIKKSAEESEKLAKGVADSAVKLADAVSKLRESAELATTDAGVQAIAESGLHALDDQIKKLDDLKAKGISTWQAIEDAAQKGLAAFTAGQFGGGASNQGVLDAARAAQQANADLASAQVSAAIEAAQRTKAAYQKIDAKPVAESVAQLTEDLKNAQAAQAAVGTDNVAGWLRWDKVIQEISAHLKNAASEQENLNAQAERIQGAIDKVTAGDSKGAQANSLTTQLEGVKQKLYELGFAGSTAQEALDWSKTLGEDRGAAQELVSQMVKLSGEADKANKAVEDQAAKDKEVADNWKKLHDDTLADINQEIAIQKAKNAGNDELATKLTKERDLRKEITQLMSQGLSYEEAQAKAEELIGTQLIKQKETREQMLDRTHKEIQSSGQIDARSLRDYDTSGRDRTSDPTGLLGTHQYQSPNFINYPLTTPSEAQQEATSAKQFQDWFHPQVASAIKPPSVDQELAQNYPGGAPTGGIDQVGEGADAVKEGGSQLNDAGGKLSDAGGTLNDAASTLNDAASSLTDAASALGDALSGFQASVDDLQGQIDSLSQDA